MSDFVKLMARQENPLRELQMNAPTERAWEALEALAAVLPPTFTYTAEPVDSIELKSQSATAQRVEGQGHRSTSA